MCVCPPSALQPVPPSLPPSYPPLDYSKLKADLGSCSERKRALILQALRWVSSGRWTIRVPSYWSSSPFPSFPSAVNPVTSITAERLHSVCLRPCGHSGLFTRRRSPGKGYSRCLHSPCRPPPPRPPHPRPPSCNCSLPLGAHSPESTSVGSSTPSPPSLVGVATWLPAPPSFGPSVG